MDILNEELPARHFRLSMGIQTFDKDRLRQMGRLGFGDAGSSARSSISAIRAGSLSRATFYSTCRHSPWMR